MMRRALTVAAVFLLSAHVQPAAACEPDATPVFSCQAANGRKFIELCAASSPDPRQSYLEYRFGSLTPSGEEKTVELVFPTNRRESFKHFAGATYTHLDVYTQSVRFTSDTVSYTVFTRAKGSRLQEAGVLVRDPRSGKSATVLCSERPRFYIFELGQLECDSETPVGKACIK